MIGRINLIELRDLTTEMGGSVYQMDDPSRISQIESCNNTRHPSTDDKYRIFFVVSDHHFIIP